MSKLSVIIPVYNTEKYLRKCLDSVCNQTLKDIEIICVNDASTDNSLEILKEYASSDNRIKVINFLQNKGAAVARNTAIDEAKGEYIGFVDSDDYIDLDFYEKLYGRAVESGADCVKGNIYDFYEKTNKSILTSFYDQNDRIKKNKAYFCYGFTSAIYKTSNIKDDNIKFPKNIIYFEDPYFSIFASIAINKVEIVDSAKYNYVRHSLSACSKHRTECAVRDFFSCIKKIIYGLNSKKVGEQDYCIYVSFLMEHLIQYCSKVDIPNESNYMAIDTLLKIIKESIVPTEKVLTAYFMNKKQILKHELIDEKTLIFRKLRENLKK